MTAGGEPRPPAPGSRRRPSAGGPVQRSRILFLINSLEGGGAERVMATLLANSRPWSERHDIALALLDEAPRAFALPEWLRVIQLDCRGATRASIAAVGRLAAEFRPDLTVSFLTRSNLASGLAMRKRSRPWIISERTSTPAHLGSRLRQLGTRAMMRRIYPGASRVIAVSTGVAARLSSDFGVPAHRVEVIPNPVDIAAVKAAARRPSRLDIDGPYAIAVGRLVKVKNHRLLLRAFARSGLPFPLVLAGDGPERDALEQLGRELGIGDRLIMPGWLADPYPELGRASLFALSSDLEGFPNALVEALALGVPSVSTNCPDGPAEILARSRLDQIAGLTVAKAGILTPVGDCESYAQALRLASEPKVRNALASAGARRSRDYRAAAIAERYWAVIEDALERARGSSPSGAPAAEPHSAGRALE